MDPNDVIRISKLEYFWQLLFWQPVPAHILKFQGFQGFVGVPFSLLVNAASSNGLTTN